MKRFAQLFEAVDETTSTNEKISALRRYFREAEPASAVWALYLLLSKPRKRLITSRTLRDIFLQISDIPEWLFEDCYAQVGDSAEVIALLLRDTTLELRAPLELPLHVWMEEIIPQVKGIASDSELTQLVLSWWASLSEFEVFILNKLLTGAFRVGVSVQLVIKAIAAEFDLPESVVAHRLMGDFEPTVAFYTSLLQAEAGTISPTQPYPFFLASALEEERFQTEDFSRWRAEGNGTAFERKSFVGQVRFSSGHGEDLVTEQFPELADFFLTLPDGSVLDGEILCWQDGQPLSFNHLQKRLGRKRVTQKMMQENPVHFIAYDLLEYQGEDIREKLLIQRRDWLVELLSQHPSPLVNMAEFLAFESWEDLKDLRERSRQHGAEGLVIKAADSPYLVGRKRGYWWKYKVNPMSLDAVLLYAQAGSGKRANLFTDYTFAVWKESEDGNEKTRELVTFAKAYSGLDNAEIEELDKWIRKHTIEKFGPVRSLEPLQVFEIGFEGIAQSNRHKSGISVRFPRILRWRKDKTAAEADTLETAMTLLQ